jgi:membrane-associated phospholipid phosphatase
MDAVSQWGVNLTLTLQRLSPGLDGIMRFLSFLGREEFFLILVTFLYWCVDTAWGMQALGILLLSDYTNGLTKWVFHAPRPYWIDPRVKTLSTEASYGIPSGHAQTGTALWGLLATIVKKPWAWAAAAALVFAISLSRLYLGVHFPHDVIAGWLIGGLILSAYLWIQPRAIRWLHPRPAAFQVAAALALTCIMLGLALAVRAALAGVTDPPSWDTQAAAHPLAAGERATDPRSLDGVVTVLGVLFGAGAGLVLMRRYAPFDPRGPWSKRLTRLVVGLVVLVGLRVGLGAIFPQEPLAVGLLFRCMRYTVVGLWTIWLAPWVFLRVGLAARAPSPG